MPTADGGGGASGLATRRRASGVGRTDGVVADERPAASRDTRGIGSVPFAIRCPGGDAPRNVGGVGTKDAKFQSAAAGTRAHDRPTTATPQHGRVAVSRFVFLCFCVFVFWFFCVFVFLFFWPYV